MRLTVGLSDALRITRALRAQRVDLHSLPHGELQAPDPSPAKRWSAQAINCDALLLSEPPSPGNQSRSSLAASAKHRAQSCCMPVRSGTCSCCRTRSSESMTKSGYPDQRCSLHRWGLFFPPVEHLALALELCGTYTLDAHEPNRGASTFGIAPATSEEEIRAFLASYPQAHIWGMQQARSLAPLITDNSWSPMETSVATVLSIPVTNQGYGLGPLVLNK